MNNDISHAISSPWASLALSQQVGISHAHWLVDFHWVCQWEKMGKDWQMRERRTQCFPCTLCLRWVEFLGESKTDPFGTLRLLRVQEVKRIQKKGLTWRCQEKMGNPINQVINSYPEENN